MNSDDRVVVRGFRVPTAAWKWVALAAMAMVFPWAASRPARAADIPGVIYNAATNHYYKWVAGTITWSNAKSGAQGLGGYLVSVTSAAEQQWLQQNLIPVGMTACLGGTDETNEGTWAWLSGEPWSYTYWNSGEPNNSGNEDYLAWNSNATWNDIVGTSGGTNGYVVEWNVNPNIPPPPIAPTSLAVTPFTTFPNPNVLTWTDNSTNEDGFEVYRMTTGPGFNLLATVGAGVVTYNDAAVSPETQYTYRVRAVNLGGPSAYSNEVTVSTPSIPTAPIPPSDMATTAVTAGSVSFQWTDNSDDEDGFEVAWRTPTGAFQLAGTVGPGVQQFTQSGLTPDTDLVFGVRAYNDVGVSPYTELSALTAPTLEVTTTRADLKDSPKASKDSLVVWAVFDFLPASPDGEFDPVAEGLTIRAGTDASPVVMKIPPGSGAWKVAKGKATWKYSGSAAKYVIQVDLANRLVKASAKGIQLTAPPANPMRVSIAIGNDAGTVHEDWDSTKPGVFRVR